MTDNTFFDEATEQSVIKATIVEKYFDTWAAIITRTQNKTRPGEGIRYIDLFSGPGKYQDGQPSTPLRVLEKAIGNAVYKQKLRSIFNDFDANNIRLLTSNIAGLSGVETLSHSPAIWNREVDASVIDELKRLPPMPGLAFVDPWGYKGLSLELISTLVQGWGCDCIFFFNFRRINAALNYEGFQAHMAATFGTERAARLDQMLRGLEPHDRELAVINEMSVALKQHGCSFVLPFCFKDEKGTRTSHHLVLATKDFKGYEVMKEIMAKYSSQSPQGVPSFSYSPAVDESQQVLFELFRPLEDLSGMLLKTFSGQRISVWDIYRRHSVGYRYILKNYKEVLRKLWKDGIITPNREPKSGFPEDIIVTFPRYQEGANGG